MILRDQPAHLVFMPVIFEADALVIIFSASWTLHDFVIYRFHLSTSIYINNFIIFKFPDFICKATGAAIIGEIMV